MTNTAEHTLQQRVIELLRRNSDDSVSVDVLYTGVGGAKVTGLTVDDFRRFIDESCGRFVKKCDMKSDENDVDRYVLSDSMSRKTTLTRTGSHSHDDAPHKGKFSARNDGFKALFRTVRTLFRTSKEGTVAWTEVRSVYRKETGRNLTTEELNAICGTQNLTKFQLFNTTLSELFEPVDSKAQMIRLVPRSVGLKTPSPVVPRSPQSQSPENTNFLAPHLTEEQRRTLIQNLLEHNASLPSPTERSPVAVVEDVEEILEIAENVPEVAAEEMVETTQSEDVDRQLEEAVPANQEAQTGEKEEKHVEDVASDSNYVTESTNQNSVSDENMHNDVFVDESEEDFTKYATGINDPEVAAQFERSMHEHRNSLPDEFEEGDDDGFDKESAIDIPSDVNILSSHINEESVCSAMNAGFIAGDSRYQSFLTAEDRSELPLETSGEQGYTTSSEKLDTDLDQDISLNISSTLVDEPPTPRVTHEFTLCSSRNESQTDMPQPDISPLASVEDNSRDASFLSEAFVNIDRKEPVPLPRSTVTLRLGSEESDAKVVTPVAEVPEEEHHKLYSEVVKDGDTEEHETPKGPEVVGNVEEAGQGDIEKPLVEEVLPSADSAVESTIEVTSSILCSADDDTKVEEMPSVVDMPPPMDNVVVVQLNGGDHDKVSGRITPPANVPETIDYDSSECSATPSPVKTVTVEVELKHPTNVVERHSPAPEVDDVKLNVQETINAYKTFLSGLDDDVPEKKNDDEKSEEKKEGEPEIENLTPTEELPTHGILVDKTAEPSENQDLELKKKKRVTLIAPRKKIFNCCAVL